jgi:hypothetical protein
VGRISTGFQQAGDARLGKVQLVHDLTSSSRPHSFSPAQGQATLNVAQHTERKGSSDDAITTRFRESQQEPAFCSPQSRQRQRRIVLQCSGRITISLLPGEFGKSPRLIAPGNWERRRRRLRSAGGTWNRPEISD